MDTKINPLGSNIFEYIMDFYKDIDRLVGGDLNKCSDARMRYGRLSQISVNSNEEMYTIKVALEYFEGLLGNKLKFLTDRKKSLPPLYIVEGQSDFEHRVLDRSFAIVHQEVQDLCNYLDDYEVYYKLVEGSPKIDEYTLSFVKDSISKLPFSFQLGISVAQGSLYFGKWGKEIAPVME